MAPLNPFLLSSSFSPVSILLENEERRRSQSLVILYVRVPGILNE